MRFRCSAASRDDGEPLAGSAPSDVRWLLLERPGAWLPKAAESLELPAALTDPARAGVWADARVQLVRRPGGGRTPDGLVAFRADLAAGTLERAVVSTLDDVADAAWAPWPRPLWLVCAHGRRDVCCAELGRPVAARLAASDPAATWETSHLGGHRFAPTLLALPSGVVLGRLDGGGSADAEAAAAVDALRAGRWPDAAVLRGRAGRPAAVQAAEAHVLAARPGLPLAAVEGRIVQAPGAGGGVVVEVRTPDGAERLLVEPETRERRQSCAEERLKPATSWRVRGPAPIAPAAGGSQ
ncbi:hypothetical protein K8Z61_12900 [Nocardioides sp. TRM66260-LWL]|uniref:sucrase ferredoxin n=1 Tax=Nocardioides sp. TRM66260-LWL TaxID=2874478 RepID=UPI001CC80299|nr:sucrase ferredoxin [Nocardioides sp. TRM66260-LWL]MBZ5735396.1 hypothetical protein [Nocardioides sp. TRM66260-LWL]